MAEEEWITAVGQHANAPWLGPVDTTVSLTLLATPNGDVISTWRAGGERLLAEPVANADVEISIPWKDAQAIVSGTTKPAIAYMQGKLKPSGEMPVVLELLERMSTNEFESWLGAVSSGS